MTSRALILLPSVPALLLWLAILPGCLAMKKADEPVRIGEDRPDPGVVLKREPQSVYYSAAERRFEFAAGTAEQTFRACASLDDRPAVKEPARKESTGKEPADETLDPSTPSEPLTLVRRLYPQPDCGSAPPESFVDSANSLAWFTRPLEGLRVLPRAQGAGS